MILKNFKNKKSKKLQDCFNKINDMRGYVYVYIRTMYIGQTNQQRFVRMIDHNKAHFKNKDKN